MKNRIKNLIARLLGIKNGIGASGTVRVIKRKAGTNEVLSIIEQKNLIVSGADTGRNLIAQRIAGTNTYSLNVTHGDIGTGTTAPDNSDVALQTPSVRGALTLASVNNNIVSLQFFFSDVNLPNGTYREFGTFVDGTATLSTGKLFNRALFGTPYSKSAGEDTTVEVEFTISSI